VLLIDDTFMHEFVAGVLTKQGMTVLTASDGERGVELFREWQRDIALVLVNIEMQGISGAAVIHRLREIAPDAVIVIVSGYPEQEALRTIGIETVSRFLPKPYTHDMLLREVRRFVSP